MEPDIDDAGPTNEHNGIAAFWQIVSNPWKLIITTDQDGCAWCTYGTVGTVGRCGCLYLGIGLVSTTTDGDLAVNSCLSEVNSRSYARSLTTHTSQLYSVYPPKWPANRQNSITGVFCRPNDVSHGQTCSWHMTTGPRPFVPYRK